MKLSEVKIKQSNINDIIKTIKKNCESCNEYKLYDFGGNETIRSVVGVFCKLLDIKAEIITESCLFEKIIFKTKDGKLLETIKID